jgi:hypothetical protein
VYTSQSQSQAKTNNYYLGYKKTVDKTQFTADQLTKPLNPRQLILRNAIYNSIAKYPNFQAKISQLAYAMETGYTLRSVNSIIQLLIARGELSAVQPPRLRYDRSDKLIYSIPLNSPMYRMVKKVKSELKGMTAVSLALFSLLMNSQVLFTKPELHRQLNEIVNVHRDRQTHERDVRGREEPVIKSLDYEIELKSQQEDQILRAKIKQKVIEEQRDADPGGLSSILDFALSIGRSLI